MNMFKMQEFDEGYNIVYAKKRSSPKRILCKSRKDVINFFINELNNIDFLSINDVIIDLNKLVNNNIKLSRYGVIAKLNNVLFLFTFDPIKRKIMDGINISDHKVYDDMKSDEMSIVDVDFRDGTLSIENFDLEEFIYGDGYGEHNIFMYIQDIFLYKLHDTILNIIKNGDFNKIAIECIDVANEERNKKTIPINTIKKTKKTKKPKE